MVLPDLPGACAPGGPSLARIPKSVQSCPLNAFWYYALANPPYEEKASPDVEAGFIPARLVFPPGPHRVNTIWLTLNWYQQVGTEGQHRQAEDLEYYVAR